MQPRTECSGFRGPRFRPDVPAVYPEGPGGTDCLCGRHARTYPIQRDHSVAVPACQLQGITHTRVCVCVCVCICIMVYCE